MASHPRYHPRSLVAVFYATSIQRPSGDSESIGRAVVGIEHRLIDNMHLVGLTGSNKTFGAPAPFSFSINFHVGGLFDNVDDEL